MFSHNRFLGAVIAASFLVVILLTINKKFSILIICFFAIGIANSIIYYEKLAINSLAKVRIIKNNEFSTTGKVNGRKILIKGNLNGAMEGDNIFIYGKFEHKNDFAKGIVGTFYADKVKVDKKDTISSLYSIKRSTYNKLNHYLNQEKTAIVMSLCFGDTNYLNEEQKYDFKKLGVIHAISVSGFHMAIIYKLLEGFLGFKASILISFLYAIFTGAQPATIRAFIMILVLKLSKKVFKNYDSLSSLSLSALIIIILGPYFVVDLGFILSYLSTLGIILYYHKISRSFYKLPKSLNESLAITLSSQTFSMPFAGMVLGNLSFGFLPGNIILLPIYTILVVAGNVALIFINIEFILNAVCKIIYVITIILDGANYILLKITPPVNKVSYIESIALLCLILSFILVKRGFNKFKYLPIFLIMMLLIQNYSFFPRIEYINLGYNDGIVINYKYNKIFIGSVKEDMINNFKLINEELRFTKVITNVDDAISIRLNRNHAIKVLPDKTGKNNSINLIVTAYRHNTIITRNSEEFMDIDLKKCDIIKVPKKVYYKMDKGIRKDYVSQSYNIILNKVYAEGTDEN